MDSKAAVEAALFSASEPLSSKQIADSMGIPQDDVLPAIKKLTSEYNKRGSAMKIVKIGNSYRMLLREEFSKQTAGVTKLEIPRPMMKTLMGIAYNQPIKQSDLSRTLGPRVYDDVPKLLEMGLISSKEEGQTRILTTTNLFSERFCDGVKTKDLRKWFDEKKAQKKLDA